jgi:hypothetical protein
MPIAKINTLILTALKPSQTATISTGTAAVKCILILSSALKASRKPFLAFLNVLENP